MYDRISIDPNICHGQACIRGTRIPVHRIVAMLANGDSVDSVLEALPNITRDDILACLEYAAPRIPTRKPTRSPQGPRAKVGGE